MKQVFLALCLGLLPLPAMAQPADSPLRSLLTADDARGYEGVGRLSLNGTGFCTAALIEPDLILTAAHCLTHPESGTPIAPFEIEFQADLRSGRAIAYRGVKQAMAHPGFAETEDRLARIAYDIALLRLDHPIENTRVLPFSIGHLPREKSEVGVISYAQHRSENPSVQDLCHVVQRAADILVFSCDADFGASGAPVFAANGDEVHLVSVISAMATLSGEPVSAGPDLTLLVPELKQMMSRQAGATHGPSDDSTAQTLDQSKAATGARFVRP